MAAPKDPRFAHLSWPKVVKTGDGTFVVAGGTADLAWHGGGSPVSTSRFSGADAQVAQWGWGYLAGRTQQQVAQMYAAAQSERTEVVAR